MCCGAALPCVWYARFAIFLVLLVVRISGCSTKWFDCGSFDERAWPIWLFLALVAELSRVWRYNVLLYLQQYHPCDIRGLYLKDGTRFSGVLMQLRRMRDGIRTRAGRASFDPAMTEFETKSALISRVSWQQTYSSTLCTFIPYSYL